METPANDKENLLENPTPRRMTRLAMSLMMRDLPGNVSVEDKATPAKTPRKTPKVTKDAPKKTPRKTPKKVAKDTPQKTPKKTPKKTPGKQAEEPKPSASASKRRRSTRKSDDVEEDKNLEETLQKCTENKSEDLKDNTDKIEKVDDLVVKESKDEGGDILPDIEKIDEEVFKEALEEKNASSTPEKRDPEKKDQADQSCVIIDDSFRVDKMEDCDPGSKSIIVIPDTPMPDAGSEGHALNETFSAEPKGIVFPLEESKRMEEKYDKKTSKNTPFKAIKSPKRLNLLSISKMVHFSPAIASSALKSSILLDKKIMSPLKSIRKRSFSTNDVEATKKMNRVTFHSPANMEITVDEIDGEMQPHIEEIRLERDAFVALRAKNKLGRRHKRSMSNAETESGRKRALHNLSGQKTPTKAEPVALGKVPNFMAIHAASFKKMENLVEYKNRKDERAKNLLSNGGKSLNTSAVAKDKDQSAIDKKASAIPVVANVVQSGPSKSAEGETKAAHVGTSRPPNKVEERQQKWRSMHKSGRHDNNEAKTGQKSAILKGVRSNRRFDLMMKFREQEKK